MQCSDVQFPGGRNKNKNKYMKVISPLVRTSQETVFLALEEIPGWIPVDPHTLAARVLWPPTRSSLENAKIPGCDVGDGLLIGSSVPIQSWPLFPGQRHCHHSHISWAGTACPLVCTIPFHRFTSCSLFLLCTRYFMCIVQFFLFNVLQREHLWGRQCKSSLQLLMLL